MSTQTILPDDTARARLSDPRTSHDAADSNSARAAVEAQVHFLFARLGGMTDEELSRAYRQFFGYDTHPDSPRKRRSDLAKKGVLVASDEVRPTVSGRASAVWALA